MENGWKSPFPCIKMIGHGVPGTSHFGFCRIFQGPSFPEEDGTIQPSAVRCKMSVSKRMHTNHGEHIQKTHETYGNNIGNTWKQYRKNTKKHKKLTVAQHHHPPQLFFFKLRTIYQKTLQSFQVISASRRAPTYLRRGVSQPGIYQGIFVSCNRFISPSSSFILQDGVHN